MGCLGPEEPQRKGAEMIRRTLRTAGEMVFILLLTQDVRLWLLFCKKRLKKL